MIHGSGVRVVRFSFTERINSTYFGWRVAARRCRACSPLLSVIKKVSPGFLLLILLFLPWAAATPGLAQPLPAVADSHVVLPPAWAFGILYGAYTNQEQSVELVNHIIQRDYPIDAFWIDSWIWDWTNKGRGPANYIDFIADTISYPNLFGFWTDFLGAKQIKAGMWVWDCIQQSGNESVYNDFKSRGFFRDEFIHTSGWHNGSMTTIIGDQGQEIKGSLTGNIDFENPNAVAYFKQRMKHFFDAGLDFIKLDKTDAIPACKTMFEMCCDLGLESEGRGFILSHSGGTESSAYKKYPGKWTDDTRSDWSMKTSLRPFSPWLPPVAFQENIAMYTDTSRHYHGIPFLANDMGGFAVSNDGAFDEELYIRWTEFSMLLPITTVFSQPENRTGNIAFQVSARADSVFRKYAHLKMKLFPYIYSYAHRTRLDGVDCIRSDGRHLYQYQLGNELLVAPVCEQGAVSKTVYLPSGNEWFDFYSGEKYPGGQAIQASAPLDKIPLFAKAGAIIPMRRYARSIEAGNNDTLEVHLFPGNSGSFMLIEDDGKSNDYLVGKFAITDFCLNRYDSSNQLIIAPVKGAFRGMAETRYYQFVIHGAEGLRDVIVNRQRIDACVNDGTTLTALFRTRKNETVTVEF